MAVFHFVQGNYQPAVLFHFAPPLVAQTDYILDDVSVSIEIHVGDSGLFHFSQSDYASSPIFAFGNATPSIILTSVLASCVCIVHSDKELRSQAVKAVKSEIAPRSHKTCLTTAKSQLSSSKVRLTHQRLIQIAKKSRFYSTNAISKIYKIKTAVIPLYFIVSKLKTSQNNATLILNKILAKIHTINFKISNFKLNTIRFVLISQKLKLQLSSLVPFQYKLKITGNNANRFLVKGRSIFVDPPRPPVIEPPNTSSFIIPVKDVYFMQNNFSVTLLDLTPVDFSGVQVGWDRDSHSWSFTGTDLKPEHINLVQQAGLTPVQLIVNINAVTIKVIVDKITTKRVFANRSITVKGAGISSLLNYPHIQKNSLTYGTLGTNQQIADSLMPIGWTINWNISTWLVTAGAYSHLDKSPIQAVADLAKEVGAVVIPDRENNVLNVEPSYPVLPWNYASSTPDYIIPDAVIIEATETSVVDSQINGVYVHGSQIGGELGFCRLTGTAGDVLAGTVESQLLTDVVGLRLLGERVLAGEATQPKLKDILIPLSDDVPFIPPNSFVKIVYQGQDIYGIVNSIDISATFNNDLCEVWQRITIGENTTNALARFKRIAASPPLLIASLSSTNGNTSVMTLIDGGVVTVRGSGTIGANYYIRDGVIEGQAPSLPLNNIVI